MQTTHTCPPTTKSQAQTEAIEAWTARGGRVFYSRYDDGCYVASLGTGRGELFTVERATLSEAIDAALEAACATA